MSAGATDTDRLAALERRIDELEHRAGGDSLSPTYMTLDTSTGAVSADFSGRVEAEGITIALADAQGVDDSSVEWVDANRNVVATIEAWSQVSPLNAKIMQLQMGPVGGPNAGIQLNETAESLVAFVTDGFGNNRNAKIIDSQRSSSFLQLSLSNLLPGFVSWGVIVTGAGAYWPGSDDWSASGPGAGETQVVLDSPAPNHITVVTSLIGDRGFPSRALVMTDVANASVFSIATVDTAGNAVNSVGVAFVAIAS